MQGIDFSNITNAVVARNFIDVIGSPRLPPPPPTAIGLNFVGSGGRIVVEKNTINQTNGISTGLGLLTVAPASKYFITKNCFTSIVSQGAQGIEFGHGTTLQQIGDFDTICISENIFFGQGGFHTGIGAGGLGFNGTGHLILNKNIFRKLTTNLNNMTTVLIEANVGANLTVDVTNNIWEDTVNPTVNNSLSVGSIPPLGVAPVSTCLHLAGNRSDNTNIAYFLANIPGGPGTNFTAQLGPNIGPIVVQGTINSGICK